MPSVFDSTPKKAKTIMSAFDSESFDADLTIHVDGLVGSATISPSGRDVALASPEGLAIIDLDSPWNPPRRLSSHGLPWLVVDVQWSPFAARDYWVASTANHRCLVWNLNMRDDSPSGAIEHSLQAHSRAITDINFSAHHPDLLASCSVDGYVHHWDLRRPRQPALTYCDWFAGATQVKYSRQDPHVIASAHDRWLHVWDDRKTVEPLKTICAHTSKIYGIDWNRTEASRLVTCSLDKTIKFWDYEKTDEPERVIRTDFPVWRARHTPFGTGLLAMSQNEPGNLYLYDRRTAPEAPSASEPVAVFSGHGNHKVKEFLWRARGSVNSEGIDEREFQLVSWGEDNELRLQKVEPEILESVGYVKGKTVGKNLAFTRTRKGAAYKTFRAVDDTVHRDRRTATMSDPRPGSSGQYRKSALSYGLNSHLRRVGPTWQGSSMKAKVNSGKSMDKSQLQIGWMKGISMTKRKSESDGPERGSIKDSGLFSHGAYDDDWAEPESIQDEFIHVSNRLPNVKWENIDMDALILNASLKGPWGVNDEGIFIKVKVDIPTSYPTSKAPKFYVEKTSFMPEETHEKIERELQILANQFLERKQNCLEVAFSYLLGDVDLENSTTLFKNVRDLNDEEIEALADESSSDEEDSDVQAGGSVSMSQDLTMSNELDPTATLAPTQRPIAVPTPRKCGARFSNDGRLVCFFPSKEQQALALFSLPNSDAYRDRQKGEPNFAGFGRLAQDSPPPRRRYNDDNSGSDDTSDGTEDSESSSSSDSEPSTMHKISLWYQPGGRRLKKTWSANDSLRSSGGGTGAGTGTGTGISRRRLPARPKNTIAIHDLRRLLPSQKQFAQEYAIFGDGADVCMHNAMVAEKYGYHDLVHIWHYAAMLLRNDIPLEIHENRKESVLVIARDASARARDDEYAQHFGWDINLSGRVKWGYHPLAQSLIADLFDYFEKVADIQMLAMLACIFGDSSAEDGVAYAGSHLPQPETPLPMKAPSFSLEYFPTDPALWHINYKSQAGSAITTPRTVHTPAIYSGSPGSEDVIALLEPTPNSFSAGETPPKMPRDHLREVDQTQSLSTSPSNRLFHRSNSAVSAAFSLPKTLAGMVSGSPPDPPSRKRPSPAEAIFNNLTPSVTWGASTVFGGTAPETPGTERTSLSDDETRSHDMTVLVPVAVSVVPENQGLFDDDGWLNTPLLDPSRNHVYSYYRYAYAEMLQMWGQPLSRLEIMKFNVLKGDKTSSSGCYGDGTHSMDGYYDHETAENTAANSASQNPAFGGRKEQLQALIASGRGLDVTGICRIHEEQLDPVEYTRPTKGKYGGAVGTCHRCVKAGNKKEQKQLRCVYCLEPIAALYPPCLSCGCAFHEACLAEWHEMGEEECPAGDDCCCVEDAGNGHVERWSALQAAVAAMNKMRSAASGSLHQQMMDRDKEKSSGNQSGISRRSSIKTVLTGVASVATEGTGSRPRRRSVPTDLAKFMRGGRSDPKAYPQNDDDYDEDDDDLPIIAITSSNGSSDRSRSAHPTNRRAVSTASPSIPPVITTTTTSPHQFGRRRGGSSASHLAATGLGYGSGYGHRSSNLSHFYIAADTDNSGDSADSNNDDTDTAAQSTASNSNRTSQILLSGNDIIDREEWESVASSRGIPSLSNDPLHPSHHSRSGSRSGSGASSRSASGGSDTGGMKDSSTSSLTSRVGGGGGGEGGGSDNSSRRPHHERTPSGNNRGFTALKPPPYGDEPISVARLSLGNRLKKHIASAASASGSGSKGGGDSGSGGNGNIAGSDSGGGETGAAGGGSGGGGNGNGNGSGNGGSSGGSSLLGGGQQRPSLLRKKSTGVGVWRAGN